MHIREVMAAVGLVAACAVCSITRADWPQVSSQKLSSPTFYDLDGDGRKEIVVSSFGQTVVYDLDGNFLMQCPPFGDYYSAGFNVAIADIDGDGSPEIAVSDDLEPRIFLFDATCHFKEGWPVTLPFVSWGGGTAPTLVDLDQDGTLEVVVENEIGVFAYRHDGTPQPNWPFLWPPASEYGVHPAYGIAAGDVDGDGFPEIVAPAVDPLSPKLFVLTADGRVAPGWPRSSALNPSAPALADLDGDGRLEIVTQDGFEFVRVFRFDGSYQPGWPRPYAVFPNGSFATPAIADVDGDGTLEIVVANGTGLLYVFRPDGSSYPGFPLDVGAANLISSPSVIDIDGDGRKEFFLQLNPRTSPTTQVVSGWRLDGTVLPGFPQTLVTNTRTATISSTDIADATGLGSYALTVGASADSNGLTWYLPIPSSAVSAVSEIDAWPRVQHDATNRSCLCTPRLNCDDGDPCTLDAVDPSTQVCTHAPKPDGAACDDGDPSTSGETCQLGICAGSPSCQIRPQPKSYGYYKRLCKDGRANTNSHSDVLTDADAVCVGGLTRTFAGISTVLDLCAVLEDHGGSGDGYDSKECTKGEGELMATALNVCRWRVCLDQEIDSSCASEPGGPHHVLTSVDSSLHAADDVLADAGRDKGTCKNARCLSREINNGHGLHHTTLVLAKSVGGNVLLTWSSPVMDDGSGEATSYAVWRRPLHSAEAFAQVAIAGPNQLTYLDDAPGDWEYEVTFSIAP